MRAELATEADRPAWEKLISETGVEHHAYCWEWRSIIPEAFGHKPYYLVARSGSEVEGIAPLFHVKSVLFGAALISVPYLNAGGIVARSNAAFEVLLGKISELASQLGVSYVELRHRAPLTARPAALQSRSHKVAMKMALSPDPEALFSKFSPKLRSQIRRPAKSGIFAETTGGKLSEAELLDAFFSVFAENMRDLGTPTYGKTLFRSAAKHFGGRMKIITAWHEQKPVAAGITLQVNSAVEIPWASSLKKYNNLSPNMLMYWEAIKQACIAGQSTFDFGRSTPDSGTFKFKRQWGAEPLPLHWYYVICKGAIPDVNPNSPKYALMVSCWRRLPLPVANSLGPILCRSLP